MTDTTPLDQQCINTLRFLSVDMVQKANSGHPGLPLGAAPMAYVLWTRLLRYNPRNPLWVNRDRFVLSAGHGSALLYSLLHLTGYDLSLDEHPAVPPVGQQDAGHPERGRNAGGGNHHRAAGAGPRQRRRHGDRRGAPGGPLQPARSRDCRSPYLCPRQRRRPHGRRGIRSGLAGRPSRARQADLPLRRQPTSPWPPAPISPSPRIAQRASRPMAGIPSRWRTATISLPSMPRWPPRARKPRGHR